MQQQQKYFWFLLGLSVLLLFPGLGKTPLWIFDEVRNAQCAREMYERGDWIVPTFNDELRTLKPPLHYYFMFGGFKLFGVTEWGARFFSSVSGVLTILLVWWFIKKYSSARHAFITCLVLLASSHLLFQFRMSVPDPYLIFLNAATIFSAFAYFREKKFYWMIICAVTMGLGALAKGPVSIVLPGGAVFFWLLWEKRLKEILSWQVLMAAIIVLAVAAPWYLLVHNATNGEWTRGFFFEHNVGRFSEPMEGHGGIFIIVPLFVLVGLLPASVFIGESVRNFKSRFSDSFLRLAFCVMAVFIVFYSFSGTKLPNYPIPCYPFVALILGYFIDKAISSGQKTRLYPFIILFVITILLPAAGYIGIKNETATRGFESLAFFLLILTAGAAFTLYFIYRKKIIKGFMTLFTFYTVFNLVFLNYLYPTLYLQNPMSKTIEMVKKYENFAAYKEYHPSYLFYIPKRVNAFYDLDSLKAYLLNNEALIFSRTSQRDVLKPLGLTELAAHHDLFEVPTTLLLTNKKAP